MSARDGCLRGLTFRLDLSVNNGQPAATVTDAKIAGVSIEQNRVDNWNQTIANRASHQHHV